MAAGGAQEEGVVDGGGLDLKKSTGRVKRGKHKRVRSYR